MTVLGIIQLGMDLTIKLLLIEFKPSTNLEPKAYS
jgi:hypothetical protein